MSLRAALLLVLRRNSLKVRAGRARARNAARDKRRIGQNINSIDLGDTLTKQWGSKEPCVRATAGRPTVAFEKATGSEKSAFGHKTKEAGKCAE